MRTFDDTFSGEKIYPGKVCSSEQPDMPQAELQRATTSDLAWSLLPSLPAYC